jgi:tRNA dimethylallyltransferase
MPAAEEPILIVILGPTASGKTALALAIAENLKEKGGAEIVSCDSVAVYREFEIGTAKPTPEERSRAPHHMIDVASADEPLTAGEYARRARAVLQEIKARGRAPIVAGGTGLYLRALLEGLSPAPPRAEELRQRLRGRAAEHGSEYLHRMLARMDRASASRIHANDTPKLIRALEVCLTTRQPLTEHWRQGRDPLRGFHIVRVGLDPDRGLLYRRINERAQQMFEMGLVDETRRLIERYGRPAAPNHPLNSLGYRQAVQLLDGELTLEQAIAAAQQGHRNYAKRQMTWFRREQDVHWIRGFGDDPEVQRQVAELLSR